LIMTDFMKLVEKDLNKLEFSIDKLISTKISFIKEIVNYIIKSGGKRVRPILVILSAKLCGYRGEKYPLRRYHRVYPYGNTSS
jgi:octaprenyl-diphosphate synthase